jgi:hypothetical protein
MSTLIVKETRDIIGKGNPDRDWKIEPTFHSQQYAQSAPQLTQLLEGSKAQAYAQRYEELNRKAIESRDKFKRIFSNANWSIFLTATLGALLLIGSGLSSLAGDYLPEGRLTTFIWALSILGIVSSALATMWISQITGKKLSRRWASQRASAEAKRMAYFKTVLEEAGTEPREQLLVFEYTRRYLLDNQLDYFRDRGKQHKAASDRAANVSSIALMLSSILTGLASILVAVTGKPHYSVIAGVGVIATAASALAKERSRVHLDRINAERYQKAYDLLWERSLELDDYREQIDTGDARAAIRFFEPIFMALEADHKQFLNDEEKREAAIGDMKKRLNAAIKAKEI